MLNVPQGEYIVMLDLPAEAKGTKALANETAQAAVERATKIMPASTAQPASTALIFPRRRDGGAAGR